MVIVVLRVFLFLDSGLFLDPGLDVEVRLPIFLRSGWKFIEVGEQHGDLPDILFTESLIPRGHAGVFQAVLDDPEKLIGLPAGDSLGEIGREWQHL